MILFALMLCIYYFVDYIYMNILRVLLCYMMKCLLSVLFCFCLLICLLFVFVGSVYDGVLSSCDSLSNAADHFCFHFVLHSTEKCVCFVASSVKQRDSFFFALFALVQYITAQHTTQ